MAAPFHRRRAPLRPREDVVHHGVDDVGVHAALGLRHEASEDGVEACVEHPPRAEDGVAEGDVPCLARLPTVVHAEEDLVDLGVAIAEGRDGVVGVEGRVLVGGVAFVVRKRLAKEGRDVLVVEDFLHVSDDPLPGLPEELLRAGVAAVGGEAIAQLVVQPREEREEAQRARLHVPPRLAGDKHREARLRGRVDLQVPQRVRGDIVILRPIAAVGRAGLLDELQAARMEGRVAGIPVAEEVEPGAVGVHVPAVQRVGVDPRGQVVHWP
mmetsp:Transcript_68256/g.197758  ORF Transcript_68256/g.197758 Transcript_68256/m.197758 type:complete len:268 (-) Transcript_68256:625-1428(-)